MKKAVEKILAIYFETKTMISTTKTLFAKLICDFLIKYLINELLFLTKSKFIENKP
jgi:hypothetical protein